MTSANCKKYIVPSHPDQPDIDNLEEAPLEAFWDFFDMFNDGSGGADIKTTSSVVYLDFNDGKIVFPNVRYNSSEYHAVFGMLVAISPFSILRYKLSSRPLKERTKWIAWAKSTDKEISEEAIESLLKDIEYYKTVQEV